MHYYKFNIGDYASHTRHLSLMEDLAYRRLLDLAYTHEKPIVNDMHSISRLIGMREYKQEIADVLKEFFVETDDGWIHERVMREIGITGAKSDSAKKSASHKWGKDPQADNTAKRSERLSAARKIASHTKEEWETLKVICENKCVRCGSVDHIVKDHIIPIYQGGSDGIDNLQPLCKTCNSSKGPEDIDYRPSGWKERLRSQAFLVKTSANTDEMPATHNTLPTTRDTLPETQDTLPKTPKKQDATFVLPDWVNKADWDLWVKTRKGKKMLPEQMQAQVAKLEKWKIAGLDYGKALSDAAINGWQGLFEPKTQLSKIPKQDNFDQRDYGKGVTDL